MARLLATGGEQIKRFDDNLTRKEALDKKIDERKSIDKEKKASALFIRGIIEAATQGHSVLGKLGSKKAKMICVIILELVSFITTTIGLMIIASDISPLIAILLALVVQLLAAYLSIGSGKRNALVLLVVLTVSIGSDFMCYLNAVSPYDAYVEREYNSYSDSYNDLWRQALDMVEIGSSDATIASAFDDVDSAIRDIRAIARAGAHPDLTDNEAVAEFSKVPQFIPGAIRYYDPIFNPVTGAREGNSPVYADPTDNTENYRAAQNKAAILGAISNIEVDFKALGNKDDANQIMTELSELGIDTATEERRQGLEQQFKKISLGLVDVVGRINTLRDNYAVLAGVKRIEGDSLSGIQFKSSTSNTLAGLKLADFSEITARADAKDEKYLRWLVSGFSKVIDSEFINSTLDLKSVAEKEMTEKNAALVLLIQEDFSGSQDDVKQLRQAANALSPAPIKEPLARAVSVVANAKRDGQIPEVVSRLLYAVLADGLVLLIGISLRRKKRTIYRANTRRELNNKESDLMGEALYTLAARDPAPGAVDTCGNPLEAYKVANLMYYLNDFLSNFEIASFVQDPNLNKRFSYVLTDTTAVDVDYKELVCLLAALDFIKPISKGQYDFFSEYKRNKALLEEKEIEERLEQLAQSAIEGANGSEKHYLMTTGCALYFQEIINDLCEHLENDQIREDVNEMFAPFVSGDKFVQEGNDDE